MLQDQTNWNNHPLKMVSGMLPAVTDSVTFLIGLHVSFHLQCNNRLKISEVGK